MKIIVLDTINNGIRISCRRIQSVIVLRGRPMLLITRMITDQIGFHSVLLTLLIIVSITNFGISESNELGESKLAGQR